MRRCFRAGRTTPTNLDLVPSGRFAPSPTGQLHLGNLRTALVAWLAARSTNDTFHLRFEDLDAASVRPHFYASQIEALTALGLDWDGTPMRQSDHVERYRDAVATLVERAETFECFCTRREIQEAARAPHGPPPGRYPGTCRDLTRARRRAHLAAGRRPARRLRAPETEVSFTDGLFGHHADTIDDVVLVRGDGTVAYNLVVVVDDDHQGVDLVVRGDDLIPSTPTQLHLIDLLGLDRPAYLHVPLVLGPTGARLAKRDGAVTLPDLAELGVSAATVCGRLARSLGLQTTHDAVRPSQLLTAFDPQRLPREPWIVDLQEMLAT